MYKIVFSKAVEKDIRGIPHHILDTIFSEIKTLSADPRPKGVKKLKGYNHIYRIRIGNYRVVYSIEDKILTIEIVKIAHRKEVYD